MLPSQNPCLPPGPAAWHQRPSSLPRLTPLSTWASHCDPAPSLRPCLFLPTFPTPTPGSVSHSLFTHPRPPPRLPVLAVFPDPLHTGYCGLQSISYLCSGGTHCGVHPSQPSPNLPGLQLTSSLRPWLKFRLLQGAFLDVALTPSSGSRPSPTRGDFSTLYCGGEPSTQPRLFLGLHQLLKKRLPNGFKGN